MGQAAERRGRTDRVGTWYSRVSSICRNPHVARAEGTAGPRTESIAGGIRQASGGADAGDAAGTVSLADALQTIAQATGNQIEGYEDLRDERVTVDVRQVPFWEALDRVLDAVKLTVDPYSGHSGTLHVEPRPDGQANGFETAYYEGPFRLEATHVTAVRDLRNPLLTGLRVRLSIAWEPRTKPISITVPLAEIVAQDHLGRVVPADNVRGRLTAAVEAICRCSKWNCRSSSLARCRVHRFPAGNV